MMRSHYIFAPFVFLALGVLASGCGEELNVGDYEGEPRMALAGSLQSIRLYDETKDVFVGISWAYFVGDDDREITQRVPVTTREFPGRFQLNLFEEPGEDRLNHFFRPEKGSLVSLECQDDDNNEFACNRWKVSDWSCEDDCDATVSHDTGQVVQTHECPIPIPALSRFLNTFGAPQHWDRLMLDLPSTPVDCWDSDHDHCHRGRVSDYACEWSTSSGGYDVFFGFGFIDVYQELDSDSSTDNKKVFLGSDPQHMVLFAPDTSEKAMRILRVFVINANALQPGYNLARPVCREGFDKFEVIPNEDLLIISGEDIDELPDEKRCFNFF